MVTYLPGVLDPKKRKKQMLFLNWIKKRKKTRRERRNKWQENNE